jgi:excinuclease ABC subunit C
MHGLFSPRRFTTFGSSYLDAAPEPPPLYQVHAGQGATLRGRIRRLCPQRPGVYGMIASSGELLYIGKAKRLRTRLLSYFRVKSRDTKARKLIARTQSIVWEFAASEFAALLRELELIGRWQPNFNVQGRPRGRRAYVCIGRAPAPYVYLSAQPGVKTLACFGPVPSGRQAREAVRRLNDWFQLRDCPQHQVMYFADQTELFQTPRTAGCLRHELGTCLGPCAAACTRPAYAQHVRAARAFLTGADTSALEVLHQQMKAAAAALAFERAGAIREQLEVLQWLRDQLDRVRQAQERYSCVYAVRGHGGAVLWYLLHHGLVQAVTPAPADAATAQATWARMEAVYTNGGRHDPVAADALGQLFLVASWFGRYPEEWDRTLPPAEALAVCQRLVR